MPNPQSVDPEAYITWSSAKDRAGAIKQLSASVDSYNIIPHTMGRSVQSFVDIDTNTNVRNQFTRRDYEYFRPNEAMPYGHREIINFCMRAYEKVGLVRNVIDLMGDFACQGIKLVHKSPRAEKFYQEWFKYVKGPERSERFLNQLYRLGNVIVKKSTGKFKQRDFELLQRGYAASDLVVEKPQYLDTNELPVRYTYLHPLSVELLNPELTLFSGKHLFGLKLSNGLSRKITGPQTEEERLLVESIPKDIREAAKSQKSIIPLSPDKVCVYYYKKDDWQLWAHPMTYVILDDLIMLNKMKLMDMAAADGAISSVRLWTLGVIGDSPQNSILPTRSTINKLSNLLTNNVNGGSYDLIWGPELKFSESNSSSYKFLGPEKYVAVYNAINLGLGVPSTMTSSSQDKGLNSNYISLKTLVERLEYGRNVLKSFWDNEIRQIQKVMGFRFPAEVYFEHLTMGDESAEKALLIQLADRNLISDETIVERFGEIPEIERARLSRDARARESGRISEKAGPWYNPQWDVDLRKIYAQLGMVTPSEVGLELEKRGSDERTKIEISNELALKMAKMKQTQPTEHKGIPQQGRPLNSKDSQKRKNKRVVPKANASTMVAWGKFAQDEISKIITPIMLGYFKKKDVRHLTNEEVALLDDTRASIFYHHEPLVDITSESVYESFGETQGRIGPNEMSVLGGFVDKFKETMKRDPSVEDLKQLKTLTYIDVNVDFE
jgi:hypothetical protein